MRLQPSVKNTYFLAAAFALSWTGFLAADDSAEAKRLIEQAIAAQGGMKALEQIGATFLATKGTIHELHDATFTSEEYYQAPNRYRQAMKVDTEGNRIPIEEVFDGEKGWFRNDMGTEPLAGKDLREPMTKVYVNRVASLIPLLREQGFSLSVVPGAKVNEGVTDGVLVHKRDQPDVRLFFDRSSHLLVKIDCTREDFDTANPAQAEKSKMVRAETFLSDYRLVDPLEQDRKSLAGAKIPADATALKELIKKETIDPKAQEQVRARIKALGDEKFAIREEAKQALIKMGPRVGPFLEEATRSPDPEVSSRAQECLLALGKGSSPEQIGAVVRIYAHSNDPDVVDVLLAYLPCAGDDTIAREVRSALAGLAAADPKIKERLQAASKAGDANLKKVLASLTVSEASNRNIGYRVYPTGVKQPMKCLELHDGKKFASWDVLEVQFYHSLPASTFAKP